jgi:phosphoenolpyruvate-protein phosphotransferase (PTS system enzyme I)
MKEYHGIPASPGYAVAGIHRITHTKLEVLRISLEPDAVDAEIERFEAALGVARRQISELVDQLARDLGPEESDIIASHLLILDDELVVNATIDKIREWSCNAESAFHDAVGDVLSRFRSLDDSYFQERILDLRDVETRVQRILMGHQDDTIVLPDRDVVVVADDLTPSDTAAMGGSHIKAFLLEGGSRTSHVAILARSLGVPAVVGMGTALADLEDARIVAVDGVLGHVIVDPDQATATRHLELNEKELSVNFKLRHLKDEPALSPDGRRVSMMANIELPIEVEKALVAGAEGIGLLRTEYIYFQHQSIPDEEEQLAVYTEIIEAMKGRSVLFRTLDVGGDKIQRYLGARKESNPFLGWRGIRFLLANKPLFKAQVRAVLRAAATGPSRLMFPMITGVNELREARAIVDECIAELADEGLAHDPDIEVGIMIETPSAAAIADLLARECDFFSLGTNDLIQYTLAMDRLNSRVAYLYQPVHPAVLRVMKQAIDAAHDAGIWAGICGEMASETKYAEVLLGLGFDEISLHAAQLPKVKQVIRWTSTVEARILLQELMDCVTADEATEHLDAYLAKKKADRKRNDSGKDGGS